uniref:Uncharacterized protein n=1 Tax=Populus alba TaxID=43335 RepID=A0A4U5P3A9_POPAL|nr:hypothetical protein D5086_0000236650 [Populus alba]
MAEGVLFNIAEEIIKKLGSLAAQEVALWWGINDQLWKLNGTVTRIKAVIQDAEEQAQKQKQNHQIEDWLKKLREAVYDAEDLLDDFSTQVLRKQLMPGKRVSREVRLFFSRSNQFVYGSRMGHRVKALRERLDGIEIDSKKFNFVRGGKRDEGAWESICQDFRRLRVLVLSHLRMKEVSPLIQKLKHLKYLDLSNNEMETISNSVTSLVNLQVLKLNDCRKLKELPRDISKLISLRHLDVGCSVDVDLCGLDELRRLNELRGRLEIRVKGYERNSCISEFEGAKLIDKQYLQSLTVWWDRKLHSDSDIDLYDKMLQSLQPNWSLHELTVEGYGGMRFPSWVSDLSNLASICIEGCRRLNHIPPLHGIPSLEELSIWGLGDLEYIDSEVVGGKGASTFFPSLKRLRIVWCRRLKGWWKRWSGDEMNDDSDESTIEEGLIMLSFPRLSFLSIFYCPNLTSMPLFPTLDEDLRLRSTSSMPVSSSSSFTRPLSKLKRLYMWSIDDMESLPEVGLQNLSSLQQLSICGCERLKSLPLPDQGMPSLQKLDVSICRELKSLSESESQGMIPYLPSLQLLRINDCSGRTSGWGNESEEEWPLNIKHIPDIVIDGYYIQKEGRYVKGEGLRW